MTAGKERVKEHKKLRDGRFQGRLSGEFSVHRIVDEHLCADGAKEFQVVWKGYEHPEDYTWELLETVEDTEAYDRWNEKDQ